MRKKNEELMLCIKRYLEEFYAGYGRTPSFREIAAAVGCGKSSVQYYLEDMEERGIVTRTDGGYMTDVTMRTDLDTVPVARLGHIPCGPLAEEYENADEYLPLPAALLGEGRYFLLTAQGDSMTGAGIDSGDLVLVRQQNTAEDGDIVVALVDNEVTLKRLFRDRERGVAVLHPENGSMSDIVVSDCYIQGVAVRVIKDLVGRR